MAITNSEQSASLANLPTELVELIVSFLPWSDILNIRTADPKTAANSFRVFPQAVVKPRWYRYDLQFIFEQSMFHTSIPILGQSKIDILVPNLEILKYVTSIDLEFGWITEPTHSSTNHKEIGHTLSNTQNLEKVQFSAIYTSDYETQLCDLIQYMRIPNLKELKLICCEFKASTLAHLLTRHRHTLRSLNFLGVEITAGSWRTVLESIEGIKNCCKVEFYAPQARGKRPDCFHRRVSFLPAKDDPDAIFIKSQGTEWHRNKFYHNHSYKVESDKVPGMSDGIFKGIDCMIRNYQHIASTVEKESDFEEEYDSEVKETGSECCNN
ncbi:hypothetical protein EJ08DRAFT_95591 [Tothia fuscella]|uniref:F-box domain-containing protein n=1 Tax=Tothia fuscella TaxID=1048955 RepID=A0A9P4NY43_9PEZI|nr:hypothetical protein EJ08DRAFT_95591 [Tothia fuscella]